jgi:hypothetical protein
MTEGYQSPDCELCGKGNITRWDPRGYEVTEFTAEIIGQTAAGFYHPACLRMALKAIWELVSEEPALGEEGQARDHR